MVVVAMICKNLLIGVSFWRACSVVQSEWLHVGLSREKKEQRRERQKEIKRKDHEKELSGKTQCVLSWYAAYLQHVILPVKILAFTHLVMRSRTLKIQCSYSLKRTTIVQYKYKYTIVMKYSRISFYLNNVIKY